MDECLGELKRLVTWAAKQEEEPLQNITLNYSELVVKAGLDRPENWIGDIRDKLLMVLNPLLEGTDYSFVYNTTDTSGYILELHKADVKKRLMGIAGHPSMKIYAFLNHDFYLDINRKIGLPENMKPNKTQDHIRIPLEKCWDVLCAATGKESEILGK